MALAGALQTGYGVPSMYHNIQEFSWNKNTNLIVKVATFLDSAARSENKLPLHVMTFEFENELQNDQLSIADLYAKLKTLDEFSAMADA